VAALEIPFALFPNRKGRIYDIALLSSYFPAQKS
jgi:hypothetical protein